MRTRDRRASSWPPPIPQPSSMCRRWPSLDCPLRFVPSIATSRTARLFPSGRRGRAPRRSHPGLPASIPLLTHTRSHSGTGRPLPVRAAAGRGSERMRHARIVWLCMLAIGLAAGPAWAHGLAGKRFYPATLTIEDPFVADELSLPSVFHINGSEGKETTLGAELAKTITPNLGLSIGAEYTFLSPSDPEES